MDELLKEQIQPKVPQCSVGPSIPLTKNSKFGSFLTISVIWILGWAHDDDLRNTLAPSTFHVPMMKLESYLLVKSILTKLSQTVIVICSVNFK